MDSSVVQAIHRASRLVVGFVCPIEEPAFEKIWKFVSPAIVNWDPKRPELWHIHVVSQKRDKTAEPSPASPGEAEAATATYVTAAVLLEVATAAVAGTGDSLDVGGLARRYAKRFGASRSLRRRLKQETVRIRDTLSALTSEALPCKEGTLEETERQVQTQRFSLYDRNGHEPDIGRDQIEECRTMSRDGKYNIYLEDTRERHIVESRGQQIEFGRKGLPQVCFRLLRKGLCKTRSEIYTYEEIARYVLRVQMEVLEDEAQFSRVKSRIHKMVSQVHSELRKRDQTLTRVFFSESGEGYRIDPDLIYCVIVSVE